MAKTAAKAIDKKLKRISAVLEDKKGEDIQTIFVGGQTWITDYFVIVSGNSAVHAKTLADALLQQIEYPPISSSGMETGKWILLDYEEIMVHIFLPEARERYKLEKLWTDVADLKKS